MSSSGTPAARSCDPARSGWWVLALVDFVCEKRVLRSRISVRAQLGYRERYLCMCSASYGRICQRFLEVCHEAV
jgi:hypothetical protein